MSAMKPGVCVPTRCIRRTRHEGPVGLVTSAPRYRLDLDLLFAHVRERRDQCRLSQRALARKLGIGHTLAEWYFGRGRTDAPSTIKADTAIQMLLFLGVVDIRAYLTTEETGS